MSVAVAAEAAPGWDLADLLPARPAWHSLAACRGVGPEAFFPTSPFHHLRSFVRRVRQVAPAPHPEAELPLTLPRRIDGPAAAAQLARDLLRHHREEITLALYLDDRHRLVGTAIVAVGWVKAARLSARPIRSGAQACRATGVVLVRYRHWGAPSATEPEDRTFRSIAAACSRYGLVAVDHVIVTGDGSYGYVPLLHG